MGQIYNVLIILAITLVMAVTTTVLAYFFDMLPHLVDNVAGIASSNNASISGNEAAAQDN
ncbi:MAG TPA: hypothetical protein VE732_00520 [Nitrososphaera sp.]|nr:hypothetical protein [Nitrososphaera sp.]